MLKKIVLAALFVSSVAVPTTAAAGPYEECLLHAGCFYDGTSWICPDPAAYMLCVE